METYSCLFLETVVGRSPSKYVLLKVLQNSQENAGAGVCIC